MQGNFTYYNPTKLYFGEESLNRLKGVAASVFFEGDYWQSFWVEGNQPPKDQRILPIGCILTMAGTGSEMCRHFHLPSERPTHYRKITAKHK